MVNLHCQFDWIWNYLVYTTLGIPAKVFPKKFNWRNMSGSISWSGVLDKKKNTEKASWAPHLSLLLDCRYNVNGWPMSSHHNRLYFFLNNEPQLICFWQACGHSGEKSNYNDIIRILHVNIQWDQKWINICLFVILMNLTISLPGHYCILWGFMCYACDNFPDSCCISLPHSASAMTISLKDFAFHVAPECFFEATFIFIENSVFLSFF